MKPVGRILTVSLLTSILVTGVGLTLLRSISEPTIPSSHYMLPGFLLACVGGFIGVIAGAAHEIVSAQQPAKAPYRRDIE